jgi:hypothetical protein
MSRPRVTGSARATASNKNRIAADKELTSIETRQSVTAITSQHGEVVAFQRRICPSSRNVGFAGFPVTGSPVSHDLESSADFRDLRRTSIRSGQMPTVLMVTSESQAQLHSSIWPCLETIGDVYKCDCDEKYVCDTANSEAFNNR